MTKILYIKEKPAFRDEKKVVHVLFLHRKH